MLGVHSLHQDPLMHFSATPFVTMLASRGSQRESQNGTAIPRRSVQNSMQKTIPLLLYIFSGIFWLPFSIILELRGVNLGPVLVGFGGLVASLVALGAQLASKPSGAFPRRALFYDFCAQTPWCLSPARPF